MSDNKELVLAAANLAREAPVSWDRFIAAFENYTGQRMMECVSAEIGMLAVAQGRAQACTILVTQLKDCKKTAESIYRKASSSAS